MGSRANLSLPRAARFLPRGCVVKEIKVAGAIGAREFMRFCGIGLGPLATQVSDLERRLFSREVRNRVWLGHSSVACDAFQPQVQLGVWGRFRGGEESTMAIEYRWPRGKWLGWRCRRK